MEFNPRIVSIHNYGTAKKIFSEVGASSGGQGLMQSKSLFYTIMVENVSDPAANIIKQEMLSKGGDAAMHRDALIHKTGTAPVLLMGTVKQFKGLIAKLKGQQFQLSRLSQELEMLISHLTKEASREMDCVNGPLELGKRTLVMGILNVTPDSFSDGGKFHQTDLAVEHALQMIEEGADIIDVGGESTRPGFAEVSAAEETARVLPVIKALAKKIKVPISVDTYKAQVGREAMEAGASILNDIWGFQREPELAKVGAEYDCPVVLMHNQNGTTYRNLMGDILSFLRKSIQIAESAGVKPEKIILDPGIGFGKDLEQNLEVMNRLEEFQSLGKPVLLGTSRKSMIGKVLDLPVTDRVEGTAATVALGIAKGVDIVRVHDIKEMVRVVRMTDAMVRR
ncbi:dihydropteroate synthase [Candidatus Formimonas warabiya]|uniref:Dihydropteroate synthase n=1 Tax=Formimonas warabiya TaxID=1761012 RepID=A0A3G1KX49_FORW1|nr:dihydropteroate synthase [Candidatus Formimonas warabiya]ATW27054.1 dihydropteroate synthase [Candidatus Formimonas warabiya]